MSCLHVFLCGGDRGGQVSAYTFSTLFLSLNLVITDPARRLASEPQRFPCLPLHSTEVEAGTAMLNFLMWVLGA